MTDEELMRAYAKGDLEAFRVLYQRHKARVLGFLVSRLKTKVDAEEVFQEVFIKLHSHRFNYQEDIPFLPWLFTIVKNASIDHIRKQKTRDKYFKVNSEEVENAIDERMEVLKISDMISELSSLSTDQQKILSMKFNDNLSFAEIAEYMNVTQPNARKIVSRAIKKLRSLMSDKEQ